MVSLGFNYVLIVSVSSTNDIVHRFLSPGPQYTSIRSAHVHTFHMGCFIMALIL